jgi:hypothetical protein
VMRRVAAALLVLATVVAVGAPSPAAPTAPARDVGIAGTRFQIELSDGRVLAQEELPGVVLAIGDGSGLQRRIRIDGSEPDPKDATGETMLYAFSEQEPASGEWRNVCQPDPDGRRLGFPLAGRFSSDMRHVAAPGRFFITCTGGAEGKCVRFGYKPWRQAPDGTSLEPLYQTCVRMVRADYCGQGEGTTRDGMPIDLYDDLRIQTPDNDPAQEFEAGWSEAGAVCVRHVRVRRNTSLDALAHSCPRLRDHLGEACTEAHARTLGAVLFNRSAP